MARINRSRELLKLIDQFAPIIAKGFRAAIADIADGAILNEIIEAIKAGDIVRAVRATGMSEAAYRPLSAAIEQAFETGGVMVAGTFPKLQSRGVRTEFRFDIRNSRAEAWLRDHSSTMVTRITNEQTNNIRNLITEGMRAGENPRLVALDLVGRIDPQTGRRTGGVIGLSGPQERYVARARAELADPETASNWFNRERRDKRFDATVQKSIDSGVALDRDTITKLTGNYSNSLLKLRGETIGRTEALTSLNKSQDEAFRQAVDQGSIKQSAVKRIWDSTGNDGRTRHSHLEMEGQTVGLDEPFVTPSGQRLMFPGDTGLGAGPEETINCRCRVKMDVDFLAGVQ